MQIFKQLQFTYGFSGKPTGFNYLQVKDSLRWNGLKPKNYINLISQMFYNYVKNLKTG